MDFTMNLAGVEIAVHSMYERVYRTCRDYLTDGSAPVQLSVVMDEAALAEERRIEGEEEKGAYSHYSDMYIEELAVYRKISETLLDYDTFLMHGSVVANDMEHAFMITAKSGVGKTTRTRVWLETFPESFVVNGDKPLLKMEEDRVIVCGTPWSGKERMNRNCTVPLKAIFMLERAKEGESTSCREISLGEAFPFVFTQTYRPTDTARMKKTLKLLQGLDGKVRFFKLRSDRSPEAVKLAYEAANRVSR